MIRLEPLQRHNVEENCLVELHADGDVDDVLMRELDGLLGVDEAGVVTVVHAAVLCTNA